MSMNLEDICMAHFNNNYTNKKTDSRKILYKDRNGVSEQNNETPQQFRIGDIVKHFKADLYKGTINPCDYTYKIVGFAEHTETGETLVVYQALYSPFKTYARPLSMFASKVDTGKYSGVKQKYCFVTLYNVYDCCAVSTSELGDISKFL